MPIQCTSFFLVSCLLKKYNFKILVIERKKQLLTIFVQKNHFEITTSYYEPGKQEYPVFNF